MHDWPTQYFIHASATSLIRFYLEQQECIKPGDHISWFYCFTIINDSFNKTN
jgi:hypothetical protein